MPKCCRECRIMRVDLKCYCGKTVGQKEWKSETRPDWCPLVALPDKHGRLGDLDALIHELNNSHYPGAPYVDAGISIAIGKVCDAPTIVESEDSE